MLPAEEDFAATQLIGARNEAETMLRATEHALAEEQAQALSAEEREQMPGDTRAFPRFPYTAWLRRPHFREIVIRAQASGNESGEVAAGDSLRPVSR